MCVNPFSGPPPAPFCLTILKCTACPSDEPFFYVPFLFLERPAPFRATTLSEPSRLILPLYCSFYFQAHR